MAGAGPSFAEIEAALAAVQKTLDRLQAKGRDAQAFELARAQFAASLRSSWPSNLATLTGHLRKVADDAELGLTSEEKAELEKAIAVLGSVQHP